jgi:23S rRNA pseudouridine1911/1915/1917 synthase
MPVFHHVIEETLSGLRLDRYAAEYLHLLSRSQIKARNLEGTINGKTAKLSSPVKQGDVLELFWKEQEPLALIPEDIPLEIVYEDEHTVLVNKPQGMVVHPGAGNRSGTLANALCYRRLSQWSCLSGNPRSGIVHRLDKDTSGIIIAAYDEMTHAFLAEQFKARRVKKTYIAIVSGNLQNQKGRIETLIARDPKDRKKFSVSNKGKAAITLYRVLKTWPAYSLVLLRPKTGRTHQLRVHMRYLGNPIVGDAVYGKKDSNFPEAGMMLHARKLEIMLPGEKNLRVFSSPLPERLIHMMHKLDDIYYGG